MIKHYSDWINRYGIIWVPYEDKLLSKNGINYYMLKQEHCDEAHEILVDAFV